MTWHPDTPTEYRNAIMTGDARELAKRLPDESVDLIFTDPVYSERPLYDWLAQEAQRILRPGGAVLCWSNGKWHHTNTRWLEDGGLTWRYDFGCVINTGPAPMNGRVIAKTNRIIWLDIDGISKMRGYLADGFISIQWANLYGEWKWTKNPVFCSQALEAFAHPDAVVLDPFAGEGTIPTIAKIGGRCHIAFEIDPDTAARARARVEQTQAMHPVLLGVQEELAL